jgi:hypothetical protein
MRNVSLNCDLNVDLEELATENEFVLTLEMVSAYSGFSNACQTCQGLIH